MPVFKRCSKCGRRISEGTRCNCTDKRYKFEDRYKYDTKEHKFYVSSQWTNKRKAVYKRFCGLDIYSLFKHGRIEKGQTVHHIVPLKEDWSLRYDDSNLILLTEKNHRIINELMKDEREKEKIIKELRNCLEKFKATEGV